MAQLQITDKGKLLSVLVEQEITPNQLSIIQSVLKAPDLTYGEVLKFLADRLTAQKYADEAAADFKRLFRS